MPNGQAIQYVQNRQDAERVRLVSSPTFDTRRKESEHSRNTVGWRRLRTGLSSFAGVDPWELGTGNSSSKCISPCVILMTRVKQNILVDSAGEARLSNVGFAKLVPADESGFDWADVGVGGCRWAAPEVFLDGKLSKQTDVFSCGFVAAEVRPPNCHFISP